MAITFGEAVSRQILQRQFHKVLGKALRAALYSEFPDIVVQVTDSFVGVEKLQPHGWRLNVRFGMNVNPYTDTSKPRPPIEIAGEEKEESPS